MRYKGQFHEVEVPLTTDTGKLTKADLEAMVARFNDMHEDLYAYRDSVETEMINLRLAAYGTVVTPSRKALPFVTKESRNTSKGKETYSLRKPMGLWPPRFMTVTTWKSEILPVALYH